MAGGTGKVAYFEGTPIPTSLLIVVLLAVAGAADTWAVVSRGTVVQSTVPDAYRGRIASLETVVGAAGPHVGTVRAGLVAAATSGGAALALGGVAAAAATALIAATAPALRRFTAPSGAGTRVR